MADKAAYKQKINLKEIETGAISWSAGRTSESSLSTEERKRLLGPLVGEEEVKAVQSRIAKEEALNAQKGTVHVFPPRWDWRSVSGTDWTTPVKDQASNGSCSCHSAAFAAAADAIESNLKIFRRDPLRNPDLAFCEVQSCKARHSGQVGGREIVFALTQAHESGLIDAASTPCSKEGACAQKDKPIVKIGGWRAIYSASQAKEWISRIGPLITEMEVCEDFLQNRGGIYAHEHGAPAGSMAICIAGYDDVGGFWICKNSCVVERGDSGWFKVAYGECGIGSRFPFYTAEFTSSGDFVMPATGKVQVTFKSKATVFDHQIGLYYPDKKLLFSASEENLGQTYEAGIYPAGTRLIFALKTSEGEVYYTDSSLNRDVCDHTRMVQLGGDRWEMRWEDMLGLAEQDFNDVVLEIAVQSEGQASSGGTERASKQDRSVASKDLSDKKLSLEGANEQAAIGVTSPVSGSISGNTIDAYKAILSFNCLGYPKKTLFLACTHGSNDLQYRIRGYAKSGSSYYNELWGETKLAHGDMQPFVIESLYSVITVEAKSAISGKASSFKMDYCGGP
jgi:C1A family cysteine protease